MHAHDGKANRTALPSGYLSPAAFAVQHQAARLEPVVGGVRPKDDADHDKHDQCDHNRRFHRRDVEADYQADDAPDEVEDARPRQPFEESIDADEVDDDP